MILGIYGAGGMGREVLELANIINEVEIKWEKIIFVDDADLSFAVLNDAEVYKYEKVKKQFGDNVEFVIAIGEPKIRKLLFNKVINDNGKFAVLINPTVHIPKTTSVGKGSVINVGDMISCNVTIGENVYIQPFANIGHDCFIEDGVLISSFSNIAGSIKIGQYSYIGMNSCVKEGTTIGTSVVIGMASAVHKNIPDNVVAMGNPARPIVKNDSNSRVFK